MVRQASHTGSGKSPQREQKNREKKLLDLLVINTAMEYDGRPKKAEVGIWAH